MISPPTLGIIRPEQVFSGSRAISCFLEELQQSAAVVEPLDRVCSWIREFQESETVRLREGSLLGDCLAELFASPADEIGMGSVEPPSRGIRQKVIHPTPSSRTRRVNFISNPRRTSLTGFSSPANKVSRLVSPSPKVDRERLYRMAGHEMATSRHANREPNQRKQLLGWEEGKRRPPPAPDHRDWSSRVTARTRDRISGVQSGRLPAYEPIGRIPSPKAARPPVLEAQWDWTLSGPEMPAGSLDGYDRRVRGEIAPGETLREQPGQPVNPTIGETNRSFGSEPAEAARADNWRYEPMGVPAKRQPAIPGKGDLSGNDDQVNGSTNSDERSSYAQGRYSDRLPGEGNGKRPQIDPPRLAPEIPALRPAPRAELEVLPMASLTAEASARREESAATDDLGDLARKLKRILDEESRRHGIDV